MLEFILEARGNRTVLRVVQSGFVGNGDWENEWFESTDYGWGFMLLSLQWCVERHPGVARQVAWPRMKTLLSREAAYARILSADGIFAEDLKEFLNPRSSFTLHSTVNGTYSGMTEFVRRDRGMCVSLKELNDGLLWVTIEGTTGKIEVQIWLSAFGLPEARMQEFSSRWKTRLEELVG
jgi:hypothetical protein